MAKAVSARRQGDEFQSIFFWNQLVNILIDENIKVVTFESDERIFVDDVIVEYSQNLRDKFTGQEYSIDAYQCKYHVANDATFSSDNLVDPKYINNKQSMLQRLYDAYLQYLQKQVLFRLHIVSSSGWDTNDQFHEFVSQEGSVRASFFEKTEMSVQGKLRAKLSDELKISKAELRVFLSVVRFDLAYNRQQILETLNANLSRAGLVALDKTITSSPYDGLVWNWYEQGIKSFDRSHFENLIIKEKLVDGGRKELLVIRHQSLNPIMPKAIVDYLPVDLRKKKFDEISLDFTSFYKDGRLIDPLVVLQQQAEKTKEIINLYRDNNKIELAYYGIAHIPLVFLFGFQFNSRKSIHVFEHDRLDNAWDLLGDSEEFPDVIVKKNYSSANTRDGDVVIKFGVSYKINDNDVDNIVSSPILKIDFSLENPTPDVIRSTKQVEKYARAFRELLDEIHNLDANINCIHLFYAGPVSLALRCGQQISPTIHPKVLVYNYTNHDSPKYKWGVCVNTPVDSPDFFVQL